MKRFRTGRLIGDAALFLLLNVTAGLAWGADTASQAVAPPPKAATSTPPLEKRSYIKNLNLLAHHFAGEDRGGKMQMMVLGDRRYLVQSRGIQSPSGRPEYVGQIVDISDALHPVVVADNTWPDAYQIQVAWNDNVHKWIAMLSRIARGADFVTAPGLRGIELYDITDPHAPKLLSQWSTDGGDPVRQVQQGGGTHRNYYDGGRYAYLTTPPDNSFNIDPKHTKYTWGGATGGLEVIDLSDPSHPSLVSTWHIPGQRIDEKDARNKWRSIDDKDSMNLLHGPVYVPQRLEDGGKYGYGPWGALGFVIHDLSDPTHPRMISRWEPAVYVPAGLPFHTIDVARLERGFVITNPEVLMPQCREPWHDSYIIDVSDPQKPRQLATLPIPVPPKEAPYRSFCERYGRFGTHNPPHIKAPGKPNPNFSCYSYFNAGLQCYDLSDPRKPKIAAYFVPEQGSADAQTEPQPGAMGKSIRTVDNVFIEWDRKLIWVASDSGLYLLSAPALGPPVTGPMRVQQWVFPSINKGYP
jgi:hypothetical protein